MTTYTFEAFVADVKVIFGSSRYQRPSQIYWSALCLERPDLAREPRIQALDPFYDDQRIDAFLEEVERAW